MTEKPQPMYPSDLDRLRKQLDDGAAIQPDDVKRLLQARDYFFELAWRRKGKEPSR